MPMSAPELYPPDFNVRPIKVERSKRANRRTATVPSGVEPVVRLIFAEIARQGIRYEDVENFSGVRRATVKSYRRKNRPGWESVQSLLSVLGFGFVPTPAIQTLPPHLMGEITALSSKLAKDVPATFAALIDIGVEQKLLRMDAAERRAIVEAHDAALHPRRSRKPANDNTTATESVA